MFSVADALLLRPLPVPRPDELLVIGSRTDLGYEVTADSYLNYLDIRDHNRTFEGVIASTIVRSGMSMRPGAAAQVKFLTLVSGNFFDVLRIRPLMGRTFLAHEGHAPGRDAVAVLTYGMWQQQYGGDPSVLGRSIHISGVDFTIVGVLPEAFTGLETRGFSESVYVPVTMATALGEDLASGHSSRKGWQFSTSLHNLLTARDRRMLTIRGRLKPGAGLAEARADMAAIGEDLQRAYPATNRNFPVIAQTQLEARLSTDWFDTGLVFLGSLLSTAVLAVACANVAGLLGSRAPQRAREIATRLAMGAARGRLIRQLITESLVLSLVGGVCGLAVGRAGIVVLRQWQNATDMMQPPNFQLDERALMFSLAVAMASAFIFGIGPALYTTRVDLAGSMKSSDTASSTKWHVMSRSHLVAIQVALSLVLVTIAVFTIQVFRRVSTEGPDFRVTQVAKISVDTAHRQYNLRESTAFFERALVAARRLPAVTSATVVSWMPLWGLETAAIVPEGYQIPEGQQGVRPIVASIDEDYFDTLDIPILAGRSFRPTDTADAPRVAIVNETLARKYWPDRSAVGRRFRLGGEDGPWVEIVGVASNSKYFYAIEPPQEAMYLPFRQDPHGAMVMLAKTSGESLALIPPLRDIVRALDSELPVYDAQTVETFYNARATNFLKMATQMIGGLGMMGMLLTMVGLYGLVSHAVSRRTREIGIRMAIGATAWHVLRMILHQGMKPTWAGLLAGALLSVVTTRMMPMVIPTDSRYNDGRTLVLVLPLVAAVALIAAFVPARRAARIDPTVALRYE
jgi:putative ABC transport system permease protein